MKPLGLIDFALKHVQEDEMNKRYVRPEMERLWSDEYKWLVAAKVAFAILHAKAALGLIRVEIPTNIVDHLNIDPDEIDRIEREVTRHDVVAFLKHIAPQIPKKLRPHLHSGSTSMDLVDTALCMVMVESLDLVCGELAELLLVIQNKALEYRGVPMIGRSHLVHAEPITFGVKLTRYYDEGRRHLNRLESIKESLRIGKLSGAVGMYTLSPNVEQVALSELGLEPCVATQIVPRDFHAHYVSAMAITGGWMTKICQDIRLMQSTEVREVQEKFGERQRGSSAMPHKRNPIGSENISSHSRFLRGLVVVALDNQETWQERDLANSANERDLFSDASSRLFYMLGRMRRIISGLVVYKDRMLQNIWMTRGLAFSQDVMRLLAEEGGVAREDAADLVSELAGKVWESDDVTFAEVLLGDDRVTSIVTPEQVNGCFDLATKIKHELRVYELAGINGE